MSLRVLILVEGQTEERFVDTVLGPYFNHQQIFLSPRILATKCVKDGTKFKGGVTSFAKFEKDARSLLTKGGGAFVTTLLDYYGLPANFPGMASRPQRGTPLQRVEYVEAALAQHFGSPQHFIPFLALHEFEAWLFSSGEELPAVMNERQKRDEFEAICSSVMTPEEINERPALAPSKRILKMFPAYRKTLHGPTAAGRIGLEKIRAAGPHFNEWLTRLEILGI
jgi:hypothetical protein